jgi:hypothetical protein
MDTKILERATVIQCVTDCTWLARHGYPDVALALRDDFCQGWSCSELYWNSVVDELIRYVVRTSQTPETSTSQLNAVRFTETEDG